MIKNRFPFSGSRNLVLNSSDVNYILTMRVFNEINANTTSAFFTQENLSIWIHTLDFWEKNKTINNSWSPPYAKPQPPHTVTHVVPNWSLMHIRYISIWRFSALRNTFNYRIYPYTSEFFCIAWIIFPFVFSVRMTEMWVPWFKRSPQPERKWIYRI